MSVGNPRGLLGEGMDAVRRPARSGRWQVWVAEVSCCSEGLERIFGADEEKMGSNLVLEGSGWHGVWEGTGSKCREAVDWTSGEQKEAEQSLLQLSRSTYKWRVTNFGR